MEKLLNSFVLTFTVWVMGALLNGVIGGGLLLLFAEETGWSTTLLVVAGCTLFFSLPSMFVFWLVILGNWNSLLLFRFLLRTGVILSLISALLIRYLPFFSGNLEVNLLAAGILASTITTIMLHHRQIQLFTSKNDSNDC